MVRAKFPTVVRHFIADNLKEFLELDNDGSSVKDKMSVPCRFNALREVKLYCFCSKLFYSLQLQQALRHNLFTLIHG
jgi:hypothetical protein